MIEQYDLAELAVLNSMHDLRISKIKVEPDRLIFEYRDIEYGQFNACNVIFLNYKTPHDLTVSVDIIVEKQILGYRINKYYDEEEFIEYITKRNLEIETINFYVGNEKVMIEGDLWDKKRGRYGASCRLRIHADKVLYNS